MDLETLSKILNDAEYAIKPDDDISSTADSFDTDGAEEIIEQGEGIYDGATTIDEMIARLEAKINELRQLKEDGWELQEPAEDDMACLAFADPA
jgi:uncharacterized phage infection (PIP) family protein YhgE